MNTLDEDVERYLKLFTFDSEENITAIVDKHMNNP
jgi:tyrosyl-tRNA synthetase